MSYIDRNPEILYRPHKKPSRFMEGLMTAGVVLGALYLGVSAFATTMYLINLILN